MSKLYLIDLDGTLYRGNIAIKHGAEFIANIVESMNDYCLLTNCPSKSASQVQEKLGLLGIEIDSARVLTSGMVTAAFIGRNYSCKSAFILGTDAIKAELAGNGIRHTDENPDCVVAGYDTALTYDNLCKACQFILKGKLFFCSNMDLTIPYGDTYVPHTGAIAKLLEAATGRTPIFCGKPEKIMLETACRIFGVEKENCVVVGDSIDTDIKLAQNGDIQAYLVLTGVTDEKTAYAYEYDKMTVINNLSELILD